MRTSGGLARAVVAFPALALLLSCAHAAADTVAFFPALEADARALRQAAGGAARVTSAGARRIETFSMGGHTVHMTIMGAGPVETALAAQALFSRFACDLAVSVGPAGSLYQDFPTGTWRSVATVVAYQKVSATPDGQQVQDRARWELKPAFTNQPPALPGLEQPGIVLASGEAFIASGDEASRLRALTGAAAVEMNAFGLAAACAEHRVPLAVWRIASDHADEAAAETFMSFTMRYDGAGGAAVAAWLRSLPASPERPQAYPNLRALLGAGEAKP